jgi:transcriptional regulator with XRE-family HTH domain
MGGRWVNSVRTAEYTRLRELLRQRREGLGVTQRGLSAKLQESETYIDKIERGVRRMDVVEFVNYANGLGVDPVELFQEFIDAAYQEPIPRMPDPVQTPVKSR